MDLPVLVRDWLMATIDVDDAQPSHRDAGVTADVDASVIGTAMVESVVHPTKLGFVDRTLALMFENPDDAAHCL